MTDTKTAKEMAEAEKGLKDAGWKRVTELRPVVRAQPLSARFAQLEADVAAATAFAERFAPRPNPVMDFANTGAGQEALKTILPILAKKIFGDPDAETTVVRENPKVGDLEARMDRLEQTLAKVADRLGVEEDVDQAKESNGNGHVHKKKKR